MNEHVLKTIDYLREKIGGLESLISELMKIEEPARPEVTAPSAAANGKPAKVAAHKKAPQSANLGGVDPRSIKSLQIIATLKEPFSAIDVRDAIGIKGNGAVYRYEAQGFLTRTEPGRYIRSKNFPKLAPAGAPPPVQPVETRASLEKKLSQALKERDQARNNGRESIVDIFQRDIDRIERQLETTAD